VIAYRAFLARSLVTLDVPQGYTLTIAATFAVASHRYGSPFVVEAWGFAVGAVAANAVLSIVAGSRLREPPPMPRRWRAVLNVTPVVTVLLGGLASYAIPSRLVGFTVAGFVASASYALTLAAFVTLVARSGEPQV
jgi:hypothetical protein